MKHLCRLLINTPIAAIASLTLAVVILNGAPPDLPLARAAAKPALVRALPYFLVKLCKHTKSLKIEEQTLKKRLWI